MADDPLEPPPKNGVFLPTQQWKEIWDLFILGFILYSAVIVPFRICFDAEAVGNMFILEQIITVFFMVDVGFNFNTAYMDDERWVISRPKIATKYFQGWFWIDAPSSVPVELIDLLLEGDNDSLGMLRFLRLFRLLRLLRLLKVGEYVAALEIRFDINLTFLRIVQMLLQLLFLSHILGCFWFYLAVFEGLDPEISTWVSSYDDGSALDASTATRYLYSVYWALTTLTTVGYGDITPTNNLERAYTCIALLASALIFGGVIGQVTSLVSAIDRQGVEVEAQMDQIKEYMRWRGLPRDLVVRMRRYYTHYYTKVTAFDEKSILENLTPALKLEVVRHSLKETIARIPLFANQLEQEFQTEIFHILKPVSAAPREVIYHKGEPPDALYFLAKGQIDVISGFDGRVLYRVYRDMHFGETVVTGRRRVATHRAALSCEMYSITAADLTDLFIRRPREGRMIRKAVLVEQNRKERLRLLSLRLLINRLGATQYRAKDVAALKLQVAYSKHLDKMYEVNVGVSDAQTARTDSKMVHTRAIEMSPARALASDSGSSGGSPDLGKFGQQLEKLDRIDQLFAKIEHLIERVEKVAPRSGGGRSAAKETRSEPKPLAV